MLGATLEAIVIRPSFLLAATAAATAVGAQTQRPMTFLDVQNMRQTATPDLSADGRSMLYSLTTPDWNAARKQSDIYLVSTDRGLSSTRQLTFTKDKNETSPKWSLRETCVDPWNIRCSNRCAKPV